MRVARQARMRFLQKDQSWFLWVACERCAWTAMRLAGFWKRAFFCIERENSETHTSRSYRLCARYRVEPSYSSTMNGRNELQKNWLAHVRRKRAHTHTHIHRDGAREPAGARRGGVCVQVALFLFRYDSQKLFTSCVQCIEKSTPSSPCRAAGFCRIYKHTCSDSVVFLISQESRAYNLH